MLLSQGAIFNSSGYPVILACSLQQAQHHLEHTAFDIAVRNHTLSFGQRKDLARKIKGADAHAGVLVLHARGALENPNADIAVDPRLGRQAVLLAAKRVETMRAMRKNHSNLESEYLVIVDRDRDYIFASDAACALLGYDRPHCRGWINLCGRTTVSALRE
jgi:PAS domain-containing protein